MHLMIFIFSKYIFFSPSPLSLSPFPFSPILFYLSHGSLLFLISSLCSLSFFLSLLILFSPFSCIFSHFSFSVFLPFYSSLSFSFLFSSYPFSFSRFRLSFSNTLFLVSIFIIFSPSSLSLSLLPHSLLLSSHLFYYITICNSLFF